MNINTEGFLEKITRVPSSDIGTKPCRGYKRDGWTLKDGGRSQGRLSGVIWGKDLYKGKDL